jgi:hypothetical protein
MKIQAIRIHTYGGPEVMQMASLHPGFCDLDKAG